MVEEKGEKIGNNFFFFSKKLYRFRPRTIIMQIGMQRDDTMLNNAPISLKYDATRFHVDPFLFWKNSSNLHARLFEVMISIIINIEEQVE